MDLECLGRGKWRCRNCDAVLSEGAALMHHRDYYCRHPQSESRAVDRERKCLGCRAALAQLSALRERAAADAEDEDEDAAEDAAEGDAEDAAGARGAAWARVLWGEGAAWRRVFDGSVVPEPTAEPGRGGIMGRLTADSLAKVLAALELRHDDAPRWHFGGTCGAKSGQECRG